MAPRPSPSGNCSPSALSNAPRWALPGKADRAHLPLDGRGDVREKRAPLMNPFSLLSSIAGALCVLLSAILYLKNNNVQKLGADVQKRQQEVQAEQQEV